jgi:ABC-type multidrug transport system ATPase subunit
VTSLEIVLGPERYTITDDRAWALCLHHGELRLQGDDAATENDVLGRFFHFSRWMFQSTGHSGLAQISLDNAPVRPDNLAPVGPVTHIDLIRAPAPAPTPAPAPPPRRAPAPAPAPPAAAPTPGWRTIGRLGAGADIEIDDPTLSATHAKIRPLSADEWFVVAAQGTVFVNGQGRSSGPVGLQDTLILGQTAMRTADLVNLPAGAAPSVPASSAGRGLSMQASALSVSNGNKPALSGLNFTIAAGSVVAVLGPSGAGKSTLMGAMLGSRRISGGELRIEDIRLRPGGRGLSLQLIRLVPQRDNLFDDLTVAETLEHAARLRLARDVTADERRRRIADVIVELGLEHRRDARVRTLSGGERRRVSIGTELVGRPQLLLLDEPTSGLDLAKDRELMQTVRRISRHGCTVIVITHSVAHLDQVDQVLVLSADGTLARSGRPDQVVDPGRPSGWADLLEQISGRPPAAGNRPFGRLPQTMLGRQITLVLRHGAGYALGQAALPIGGAAIAAAAARDGLGNGPSVAPALAILVTVAALSGAALTYLEIVTAEGIFKRDWRAGAGTGRLVGSLFTAYGLVSALIAAVMTGMFHLLRPGFAPAFGVPPVAAFALIIFGVLLASTAIGILISSLVSSIPHAVTTNTVVAIAQVVLTGSLFQLPTWLSPITLALPARLGFAAAASYGDLNTQRQGKTYTDPLWNHTPQHFWLPLAGLLLITIAATSLATLTLDRRWRRRVE